MNPQLTAQHLDAIFSNFSSALRSFIASSNNSAAQLLLRCHLPLLLLFPLATALSPLGWLTEKNFDWPSAFIVPPLFAGGLLLPALLFDKIMEHESPPQLFNDRQLMLKNIALFAHLPVGAAGIFFIIYQPIGYLMLFTSFCCSLYWSIIGHSQLRRISPAYAIASYLKGIVLLLLPLLALLFILNLIQSYQILQKVGIL